MKMEEIKKMKYSALMEKLIIEVCKKVTKK